MLYWLNWFKMSMKRVTWYYVNWPGRFPNVFILWFMRYLAFLWLEEVLPRHFSRDELAGSAKKRRQHNGDLLVARCRYQVPQYRALSSSYCAHCLAASHRAIRVVLTGCLLVYMSWPLSPNVGFHNCPYPCERWTIFPGWLGGFFSRLLFLFMFHCSGIPFVSVGGSCGILVWERYDWPPGKNV